MANLDFLIAEFQESALPALTPREIALPDVDRKATVILGVRRAGKTFLLYQEIPAAARCRRRSPRRALREL